MEMVRLKCGFENSIDVGSVGSKERISLGWKGNFLVHLKSFSSFHIDAEIHDDECDVVWRLMGFYGNPEEKNRRESWDLLRRLGQEQTAYWIVLGDFNEIIHSFKKKGGRLRAERQMEDFRMALDDCGLINVGYVGRWFTWERGRVLSTNIRERLDRGVATLNWFNLCPQYQLEHLTHSFSDHCPILLDTLGKKRASRIKDKPFRFEAKWCLEDSLEEEIKRFWNDSPGGVPDKLGGLGQQLQSWSNFQAKCKRKNRLMLEDRLNCLNELDPTDEILGEITDIQLELNLEADQEEIFWEQRARVNWLKNGDRNTSYFHKVAVQRQIRGQIKEIEG
ncbi:hypothetical protein CXB51_026729 [Gossypium anomalum]|uniref:Reverse transcriptase n=1 Tax=Gossypium anomalum TaxID=47600 RepID=A0A8J5YNA9_9ROSI|nr:hypothetical protein CXB51_026729 [Gossypium anomalum]